MCKELVSLNTQDVSKAMPITDSLLVAEKFKKSHNIVMRDIRKLEQELISSLEKEDISLYKFVQSEYIDERGKKQPFYQMNRDFFLMLVMGYRTKEAYKIKHKFIQAFNFMEKELQARIETRHLSIEKRKSLTDTIKNCVTDESNFKKFAYSTYSKLVYKKVLGKTVKKAKEELGLKETDNIRNFLTIEQLERVQDLESKIATYIEFTDNSHKTDKEIYRDVKNYIEK